jgi:hypothetical protein
VCLWCAGSESVFRFFPARQVPKIILNKYYRNTENALFEGLGRETKRYRGGLGSKGFCDIPYKKIQKASKIPLKGPFLDILYGRF